MRGLFVAYWRVWSVGTAQSATISWTKWKRDTLGLSGTACGVVDLPTGRVQVHYRGEVRSQSRMGRGRPLRAPPTTFSGGTVGNRPPLGKSIFLGRPKHGDGRYYVFQAGD
jgi:hypothetical protein